jgi:hypothetical protein
MTTQDRRRAERHPVDIPGELFLAGGRSVPVRIQNLGELGALLAMADLEQTVGEGDRAVLDHPLLKDGKPSKKHVRTPGSVMRVELEFEQGSVARYLAIYFDGGGVPTGYRG